MTSNAKVAMPAKSGQFDLDIPDTSSKLANKFIPMQLRTQPSNLGMGQLQRMNTTLMGDLTGASRRLSGSPGKAHKLGSSPGMGTHRTGEPDSMLLQQSWGLNSSSDLGALQN
ncbi:hypothetical protein MAR_033679, partial [Mya arenaria]